MLVVNFFLFRVLPGDPARTLGRGRLSTAGADRGVQRDLRAGRAASEQFVTFLKNTFNGDLGLLDPLPRPGLGPAADRLWPTLLLVGTSTLLAALIGVWMGVRRGWDRGGRFDKFSTGSR